MKIEEVADIISDYHQIVGYVSLCDEHPTLQTMVNDLLKKMMKLRFKRSDGGKDDLL